MRTVFTTLLGSLLLTCCSPTYAPPVRTTHFGMPGHLQGGKVELAGGVNINQAVACGGPTLALALTDWLQLEGGMDLSQDSHEWAMYFGGIRASLGQVEERIGGALDLELGGGWGVGGEYKGNEDTIGWEDRSAAGWYFGGGAGFQIDWFSMFLRGRLQITRATEIPETTWWTMMVGVQASILDYVNIYVAGGGVGYQNSMEHDAGGFGEIGLSFELPVFYKPRPKKKEREPEPLHLPLASEKKPAPRPPPVPVKKKPPKVARVEEKKDEVTKEPRAEPEVRPEVEVRPCPSGAQVIGQLPPDGFELFCAVPDPEVRWKHHGWYIGWYGNGQKASEGEYVDGKRHGTWSFWHKNGQKRLEAGYRMGEKQGRWKFWDKDGVETKVID